MVALVVVILGVIPGSGRRLSQVTPGWVVLEVVFELGALASYVVLFHRFFSLPPHRFTWRFSAQVGLGELGGFVIFPFGAGGPALRFWALLRAGMAYGTVIRRAVAHDLAYNIPYVLTAVVLGVMAAAGVGPAHISTLLALAPLMVVGAVGVGGLALLALGRREAGRQRATTGRLDWLYRETVTAVPPGLQDLRRRVRDPAALLSAFGYWIGDCGVLVLAFHAAGGSANLDVVVLAYMLGQLGNLLPLPGGVGGVEPIVTGVLTSSGVGLGLAGAAIILYRLVSLSLQALGGVVSIGTLTSGSPGLRPDAQRPVGAPPGSP